MHVMVLKDAAAARHLDGLCGIVLHTNTSCDVNRRECIDDEWLK